MKSIEKIKSVLRAQKEKLKIKYNIKEIGIFGSYVREDQDNNSDIDILVEFSKPIDFFKFLDLEEELQNILNIKVDLVSKKALKPIIGKYILNEVIMV